MAAQIKIGDQVTATGHVGTKTIYGREFSRRDTHWRRNRSSRATRYRAFPSGLIRRRMISGHGPIRVTTETSGQHSLSTGDGTFLIERQARFVVKRVRSFAKEGVGFGRTVIYGRQTYASGFAKCTHHVEHHTRLSRLVEM